MRVIYRAARVHNGCHQVCLHEHKTREAAQKCTNKINKINNWYYALSRRQPEYKVEEVILN